MDGVLGYSIAFWADIWFDLQLLCAGGATLRFGHLKEIEDEWKQATKNLLQPHWRTDFNSTNIHSSKCGIKLRLMSSFRQIFKIQKNQKNVFWVAV
jgi:hypothetical protein